MKLPTIEYRAADISESGKYRYSLERRWEGANDISRFVLWVMLNPSTADGLVDDPTIRRCIDFTQRLGMNRMIVVNLYPYRSTDPKLLRDLTPEERYGDNGIVLRRWMRDPTPKIIVAAWGSNRIDAVPIPLLGRMLFSFGRTTKGEPRHPLYLRADTQLEPCPWP